jgi:adenylosuccinate lyase
MAQCLNANLNITSEHQRDLTDSASSRFYTLALAGVVSMAERLNRILSKIEVDEQAMQRNLEMTGGAIAAEPLYLILEKYGHVNAHEKSKSLAHSALSKNAPLKDMIISDKEAASYWQKFTLQEKNIITSPEKYYVGLATKKTLKITKQWRSKLNFA